MQPNHFHQFAAEQLLFVVAVAKLLILQRTIAGIMKLHPKSSYRELEPMYPTKNGLQAKRKEVKERTRCRRFLRKEIAWEWVRAGEHFLGFLNVQLY